MFQPLSGQQLPSLSNKYRKYIRTYTGRYFYPANIEALEVDVVDIAHALSNVCRYNGHLKEHYSVAQHSIIVSELVPEEMALEALMHDACEAYIPDMPSALKGILPEFVEYQERLNRYIFQQLGLKWPLDEKIDFVDKAIRYDEMCWMAPGSWGRIDPFYPADLFPGFDYKIVPEQPDVIESRFIDRYYTLREMRM